jgi:cytochrome c-type biogenesis protein CcmH/NrfF
MRGRIALGIFGFWTLAATLGVAGDAKTSLKSVGDQAFCQCGCNQTLSGCNHVECSSRSEMNDQIQKGIAENKSQTTILQDLVLRYGVKVLASPPASGVNLVVWILPGVGLAAGLAVVMAVVRRWQRPRAGSGSSPAGGVDPQLLAAIEREMKTSGLT